MFTGTYQYNSDGGNTGSKAIALARQPSPGEMVLIIVGICAIPMCGLAFLCYKMFAKATSATPRWYIGRFFRAGFTRRLPESGVNVTVSNPHSPRNPHAPSMVPPPYEESNPTPSTSPPAYEEPSLDKLPLVSSGVSVVIELPSPTYSTRP